MRKNRRPLRTIAAIAMVMMLSSYAHVYAECPDRDTAKMVFVHPTFETFAAFRNKGVSVHGVALDLRFGRGRIYESAGESYIRPLQLLAFLEYTDNLYRTETIKTYYQNWALGGGLAYRVWESKNELYRLQLKAKVGSSLKGADWKQTIYDAAFKWSGRLNSFFDLQFGIGYRYNQSRSTNIGDRQFVYATIGIGI